MITLTLKTKILKVEKDQMISYFQNKNGKTIVTANINGFTAIFGVKESISEIEKQLEGIS